LPETLRRKLWQKLSFDEFDIGSTAKIIVDENEEQTQLMCTKDLAKESDVYLIDHAWTFQYNHALPTLLQNEALVDRIEKMTEDWDKLDLPEEESKEEKKDGAELEKALESF
jgi:tubulin--tyrosine ligase-like protein 12